MGRQGNIHSLYGVHGEVKGPGARPPSSQRYRRDLRQQGFSPSSTPASPPIPELEGKARVQVGISHDNLRQLHSR